jgi:type IV pilus assembly protein PilM
VRGHRDGIEAVGAARRRFDGEEAPNADELAGTLREALASGGFAGRRCVVSLPREDTYVRAVRLPQMPDSELREAAGWEAAQRFGMERAEIEVDFIRTGSTTEGDAKRDEVLLIAAAHEAINPRLEAVLAAGMRPIAIETNFTALARTFGRLLRRESDRDQVRVVVEVGEHGSCVLVTQGDNIVFCKPLEMGGRFLTEAVSESLQIDTDAARELRAARVTQRYAEDDRPGLDESTDRAVHQAVRPLLSDFARDVLLCIRYYGVTFRGYPPQRLLLTGGDGLEPHLDEALSQSCNLPVGFDDDANSLDSMLPSLRSLLGGSPGPASSWAVATGLSLRGTSRRNARHPAGSNPVEPRTHAA